MRAGPVPADVPFVLGVSGFPARHGFSTTALGSVGLTGSPDPDEVLARRKRLADAVGFDLGRALMASQVHGATVAASHRNRDVPGARSVLATDALVTDIPGQALLTYHADCFPVLFSDASKGVVAAAHAGWRGTLLGIVRQTLETLHSDYGTDAADVEALIGPGICQACYQVGRDVADAFVARFGASEQYLALDGDRVRLDLQEVLRLELTRAGVPGSRIRSSGWCTREDARWFSHRGGRPGRFFSVIVAGV